jgi:hypothetical protein
MKFHQACLAKPKWLLAGHCLLIMKNTTCGFGELEDAPEAGCRPGRAVLNVHDGAKNDLRVPHHTAE